MLDPDQPLNALRRILLIVLGTLSFEGTAQWIGGILFFGIGALLQAVRVMMLDR